ncbi:hypothetical protein [Kribbella sp. ALI-6-A]|nr:hypothetical protein [Kribbella sp. ALI-6-A]
MTMPAWLVGVTQNTADCPSLLGAFHWPYSVEALQLQRAQTR